MVFWNFQGSKTHTQRSNGTQSQVDATRPPCARLGMNKIHTPHYCSLHTHYNDNNITCLTITNRTPWYGLPYTYFSQSFSVGAHICEDDKHMFLTLVCQELGSGQGNTRSDDTLNATIIKLFLGSLSSVKSIPKNLPITFYFSMWTQVNCYGSWWKTRMEKKNFINSIFEHHLLNQFLSHTCKINV